MTWSRPSLPAGHILTAAEVDTILDQVDTLTDQADAGPLGIVAYGNRQTNSTGTTTIVGVLELDDIPLTALRAYRIRTSNLRLTSGANDGVTVTIRATTDGSTPTTASTAIATASAQCTSAGVFETAVLDVVRVPAGNETFSALLCVARTSGTAGNSSIGGNSAYPIELVIEDLGLAVADTGVDI